MAEMRHPRTFNFLAFAGRAISVAIASCAGLVLAAAQLYDGVKRWVELRFYEAWPIVTAWSFILCVPVIIVIYFAVLIYAGGPSPKSRENSNAYSDVSEQAFQALGNAIGQNTDFAYEKALASLEPIFLLLNRAGIRTPELRRGGARIGVLRADRYLTAIHPLLVVSDYKEATVRAREIVPSIEKQTEEQLWHRYEEGLGVDPLSNKSLPDMPVMELAERIYARKGPLPAVGRKRREYWDEVSTEILRGIVFNKLHMWAAEKEYRSIPSPSTS